MMDRRFEARPLPPYIPVGAFVALVARLHETITPLRITNDVMPEVTGPARGQLFSALRFLGLIEDDGIVTDSLRRLTRDYRTRDWPRMVSQVVTEAYRHIIGDLDITTATPNELHDRFRQCGVEGQMLDKMVRFYLGLQAEAGWRLSPRLRWRSSFGSRQNSLRFPDQADFVKTQGAPGSDSGVARFTLPIPGKTDATIIVPQDIGLDDWDMVDAIMRAYIVRQGKMQRKEAKEE